MRNVISPQTEYAVGVRRGDRVRFALMDGEIKRLLGLEGTSAQIALGYACAIAARRA